MSDFSQTRLFGVVPGFSQAPGASARALPVRRFSAGGCSGKKTAVTTLLVVSAVFSIIGVVVFFALTLWAAREDGRDQRRRDARLK